MMKEQMTLAERIKVVRGSESQETFAAKIGLSRATLSLYERGVSEPNAKILRKICDMSCVSPEWLLLGKGATFGAGTAPLEMEGEAAVLPQSMQEHLDMAELQFREQLRTHIALAERERDALLRSLDAKDETIREMREQIALYKKLLQSGRVLSTPPELQESHPVVLPQVPPYPGANVRTEHRQASHPSKGKNQAD